MNANVLLAHYGITLPANEIASTQFLVRSVKETSLERAFDLTGIYYNAKESVEVVLRIYFASFATKLIFDTAGIELKPIYMDAAVAVSEDEDAEDADGAEDGRQPVMFYVEYPLSSTNLEETKDQINNHPEFVRLYNKSEKNANTLDKKLIAYNRNLMRINSMGNFEPDELDEDGDEGLTGGAALSANSINAQADAHREEQAAIRQNLTDVLDYFETKVLKDGSLVEELPFNEALVRFKDIEVDGESILSAETLVADLAEEIIVISSN